MVKATRSKVTQSRLEFLHELYENDVPLDEESMNLLIEHGYIETKKYTKQEKQEIVNNDVNSWEVRKSSPKNIEADSKIDIIGTDLELPDVSVVTISELEQRRRDYGHLFEGRTDEVKKFEWMPRSTTDHDPDFVEWINSINLKGFRNRKPYRKFTLYCQQAYQWLSDGLNSYDFEDEEAREDYRQKELARCEHNNLYFLNKYVWYKDADAEDGSGRIKYVARPVHEFMAYLDDCGYSVIIAKARQIAATTTLMAIDVRDVVFKTNHFMKFITEDEEKAIEIFGDKLKFAFENLEDWMRPNVLNDRDNLFAIGYREEKGKKEGAGSKIQVDVPKRTAIAGGAPNKVKIDEGGNIPLLGVMRGNAKPTQYWFNPKTNRLEMKRRIWIWGTGGELDKGGGAFQAEFMTIYNAWMNNKFEDCMVPIFFDWTCRFGATEENYQNEKESAYRKGNNPADPHAKRHIVEFHQSWPRSLEDVFMTSTDTLLDAEFIENNLKRIRDTQASKNFSLTKTGYFEPIYDESVEMPEGFFVPYKIIGANFVPTSEIDGRATSIIFSEPKKEWANRYFQGTDPIDTDDGTSDFSSTVWDKHIKTPAALLAWRSNNPNEAFLQSLLLNIYYGTPPELVESNRGRAYINFITSCGYGKHLVYNYDLPDYLQTKSTKNNGIGIDSHGERTTQIITFQGNAFAAYGDRIYISKYYEQAKTFKRTITSSGNQVWGPSNKKYFKDDALWSYTYSYICGELCYGNRMPENREGEAKKITVEHRLVRVNGQLVFRPVRVSK